ncbi:glutamine amidotransferase [Propionibacterium sp.]|uniref:glutamine amidotransferase n=1 Tax=Propionibacterium sp. TaxID=1977903 RepID=UPI0039EBF033
MKPFLLLGTREHDEAATSEFEAVRSHAGLTPDELIHLRVEAEPVPPLDLADFSGMILGGGSFNASDPVKDALQRRVESDLASLVNRAITEDFPFLGLCYGVGVVTSVLGGTVNRDYAETAGPIEVKLTEEGAHDPVCAGLAPSFHAFVGHKEACSIPPRGAAVLALGEQCPVQMYRIGAHVYVTQFHPELAPEDFIARISLYKNAGYFDPNEFDRLCAEALTGPVNGRQHLVLTNFVQRYATED